MSTFLGVSAVVVLGLVALAAVSIIALTMTVRHLLRFAAARAIDRVVQAGERQVVSAAKSVAADMQKRDPKRIEADVTRLAQTRQGCVSVADVMAALDVPQSTAQDCLAALVRRKVCRVKMGEKSASYIFENFLPKETVRQCEFCGTDFGGKEVVNCPNCGGAVSKKEVRKES